MAREARKESKTGYYHVMMRGNNKSMIFIQPKEKQYFKEQLQYQVDDGNISIVAYCFMDNHVHLLIHSDLQTMTEALKWINIKFAGRYNHKYDRVGHVFQDRYKSEVINTVEHLLQAIRYIHNNPVKAKMVTKVSDYSWSSYKSYTENEDKLISSEDKQMIMDLFSGSIVQFKKFHLEEEKNEFLEIQEDLEREREEKAMRIIRKYCEKYGIIDEKELGNKIDILEEVVIELLISSHFPHRRIAELTGITRGKVHSIAKKFRGCS